ncbi:hypothetical protein [Paenibacillus elgii]|uniref:hypothetical protein n=1 Tax=Paenibacillus elgii TaxID=189691 RepID=UPI000248C2F8|nr:hypothetical protein [Paenibacillus elgii]
MSEATTEIKYELSRAEAYKAGWRAGYYYGRLAQLNGEPYDERTLVERAETATETDDGAISTD